MALKEGSLLPKRLRRKTSHYLHTIESQMRGCLHVHAIDCYGGLDWTAKDYDEFLSAHLPTPEEEERWRQRNKSLTRAMQKFMVHKCTPGYCGGITRDGTPGRCRFGFPFKAQPTTTITDDGDVLLWRRISD